MSHHVHLLKVDSLPLAVVQRQVRPADLPRVVPEGCGFVWNALRAQGIKGGRHVALYWEWNPSIRLEVGAEVSVPFAEQDGVVRSATPSGTVATVIHMGPYHRLKSAHDALHDWCKAEGHRIAGPSWEIYGHWQPEWDADPSLIRTDIFYSIANA